ncbi:MAG: Asp-tRNA(Asn)/Glu-tRNA(Gln) amidotransferase subunit GatC [Clostridia bacterium]|nr:Asp-tRNA(Asn)/Glu-tRNA(Gln) amidotransferase subunit GatC [Clostridia bacterium]
MQVSKEEILHIADLAELELEENEIENYIVNLQDILNFANIVNNAPVEGVNITIGASESKNVFRKDEKKVFDNIEGLLQNAPEQDRHMFKIPKVLN